MLCSASSRAVLPVCVARAERCGTGDARVGTPNVCCVSAVPDAGTPEQARVLGRPLQQRS